MFFVTVLYPAKYWKRNRIDKVSYNFYVDTLAANFVFFDKFSGISTNEWNHPKI